MRLRTNHVEEAESDIERVSHGKKDEISLVSLVHGRSNWEVSFIDPATLLYDSLALEALVLKIDVQSEPDLLVRACSHTGNILEVLAQKGVARPRITGIADRIELLLR